MVYLSDTEAMEYDLQRKITFRNDRTFLGNFNLKELRPGYIQLHLEQKNI